MILQSKYFVRLNPNEVPASAFQTLILRHWEVENRLHLLKDRYFEEDKHVHCGGNLSESWTLLMNMALSLTRFLCRGERTLREVHEKCSADPRHTAKRLGFFP